MNFDCIFVVLCFSMVRKFLKFKENTIARFNLMLIFLRASSKLKVKQVLDIQKT